MSEYIALAILAIILFALYFYREQYSSGIRSRHGGQHINYNFDVPHNQYHYNRIEHYPQPPDHDMVLHTEELFQGLAVPVRKGKSYLIAEQISPHFKIWYFKSISILPQTKIRLYAMSASSIYSQQSVSVNFINQSLGILNINSFIKEQPELLSSEFGEKFNKNIINTKYYLQEL